MAEVKVRVPGKINLALRVGPRREDGYHELATIFQAVSLYDDLTFVADEEMEISCEVLGAWSHDIGPGSENLAIRAALALREHYTVTDGVRITIDKRIPVAGGMAGGSADAAGTLLGCAQLWGLDVSTQDLMDIGASLGSDVPFALMGGCALGRGRGEVLVPVLSRGTYTWVLAISRGALSTPHVFRQFDDMQDRLSSTVSPLTDPEIPTEVMWALTTGDSHVLGPCLVNDLQQASIALMPDLAAVIHAGHDEQCVGTVVSGSGPTVAFLMEDEDAATEFAVEISGQGVTSQVRVVSGPVQGATVIEA